MGQYQRLVPNWLPGYMQGPNLTTLAEAYGAEIDAHDLQVLNGRLAAVPYAGGTGPARQGAAHLADGRFLECEPYVLPIHARDRGITLYPTEPLISQRYRLSIWHQLHMHWGTHLGEILNLRPFFLGGPATAVGLDGNLYPTPWITTVFQDNAGTPGATWCRMDPSGLYVVTKRSPSNFNYDNQPAKRTRFFTIVHLPPGYSTEVEYDDGTVYDGGALYDGVTAMAIADMVSAIKEPKAASSRLAALIFTKLQPTDLIPGQSAHPFDPASSSTTNSDGSTNLPVGNWGSIINAENQPTRPNWASWVYQDPA